MAKNKSKQRHGEPKNGPTLLDTYILQQVGAGLWTQEKGNMLGELALKAVKEDETGTLAQRLSVVSYTMDPEVRAQILNIHQSMDKIKEKKAKRSERMNLWYEKTFGNKTPEELSKKDIEKWNKEADRIDALDKSDDRTLAALAKSEKDLKYPEEIKEREAIHQTQKNEKFAAEFLENIDKAEAEKEKKKEEEKQRKFNMAGMVAGQLPDIGAAFLKGKSFR